MAKTRNTQISHAVFCYSIANSFLDGCRDAIIFKALGQEPDKVCSLEMGKSHLNDGAAPSSDRLKVSICRYADKSYTVLNGRLCWVAMFRLSATPFLSQG